MINARLIRACKRSRIRSSTHSTTWEWTNIMSSVKEDFSLSENEGYENDTQQEREQCRLHGRPYRTSFPDDTTLQGQERTGSKTGPLTAQCQTSERSSWISMSLTLQTLSGGSRARLLQPKCLLRIDLSKMRHQDCQWRDYLNFSIAGVKTQLIQRTCIQ